MLKNYTHIQVGILGGGQLARMMALSAHKLGLQVHVLSSSPSDPAAQVTSHWHQGSLDDPTTLEKFLSKLDFATFESEFLDAGILQSLAKKVQATIQPSPQLMGQLQDRLYQKKLFDQFGLPTSPYIAVSNIQEYKLAQETFPQGFVLKKRRFGYDGYGTYVIRGNKSPQEDLEHFFIENPHGFIAEAFIPFKRELALSLAINDRNYQALPLMETYQQDSRCLWVKGPIQHKKLARLQKRLIHCLKEINYHGVIAFELFDIGKELLINEVAPRVHNSAHYSQNALNLDQFSLHWLAVMNEPLPPIKKLHRGFAMYNLLGDSTKSPEWKLSPEVFLHWYGKTDNRPGRKMGHLNSVGASPGQALQKAKKARKGFQL